MMGNSSICDTNGNLLLSSDGYNVYSATGTFIDNGDTLVPIDFFVDQNGWSALSQSSIFLPMDSGKYYFVTPTMSDTRFADCIANNNCFFDLLLYNVIDMNANAGAGKVVKRMQVLMDSASLSKTQMMACRHGNGKDWWLLKQGGDSNRVYKFLFTQDSVYDYGSQIFNAPLWGVWDLKGQSVFTQDGKQYATTVQGNLTGEVFIADFDRCTGELSNPKVIAAPEGSQYNPNDTTIKERLPEGLAYSPNGKLLYVMTLANIYQYDFQDSSWYHVAGLDTTYQKFQHYNASYLGPDNKIYIGNFGGTSKQMSVINNPDVKGAGCNFCPRCLRLDTLAGTAYAGTPPCMPNYSLGKDSCFPDAVVEYAVDNKQLTVYPNPASSQLNIENGELKMKELYNAMGQMILITKADEIDVKHFPRGLYYLRCNGVAIKVVLE